MPVDLNAQRWKIRYSYAVKAENARDRRDGREVNTTFLKCGQERLTDQEAAEATARTFRHAGPFADITIWQETTAARDARLANNRRAEQRDRAGMGWDMGGAN